MFNDTDFPSSPPPTPTAAVPLTWSVRAESPAHTRLTKGDGNRNSASSFGNGPLFDLDGLAGVQSTDGDGLSIDSRENESRENESRTAAPTPGRLPAVVMKRDGQRDREDEKGGGLTQHHAGHVGADSGTFAASVDLNGCCSPDMFALSSVPHPPPVTAGAGRDPKSFAHADSLTAAAFDQMLSYHTGDRTASPPLAGGGHESSLSTTGGFGALAKQPSLDGAARAPHQGGGVGIGNCMLGTLSVPLLAATGDLCSGSRQDGSPVVVDKMNDSASLTLSFNVPDAVNQANARSDVTNAATSETAPRPSSTRSATGSRSSGDIHSHSFSISMLAATPTVRSLPNSGCCTATPHRLSYADSDGVSTQRPPSLMEVGTDASELPVDGHDYFESDGSRISSRDGYYGDLFSPALGAGRLGFGGDAAANAANGHTSWPVRGSDSNSHADTTASATSSRAVLPPLPPSPARPSGPRPSSNASRRAKVPAAVSPPSFTQTEAGGGGGGNETSSSESNSHGFCISPPPAAPTAAAATSAPRTTHTNDLISDLFALDFSDSGVEMGAASAPRPPSFSSNGVESPTLSVSTDTAGAPTKRGARKAVATASISNENMSSSSAAAAVASGGGGGSDNGSLQGSGGTSRAGGSSEDGDNTSSSGSGSNGSTSGLYAHGSDFAEMADIAHGDSSETDDDQDGDAHERGSAEEEEDDGSSPAQGGGGGGYRGFTAFGVGQRTTAAEGADVDNENMKRRLVPLNYFRDQYLIESYLGEDEVSQSFRVRERKSRFGGTVKRTFVARCFVADKGTTFFTKHEDQNRAARRNPFLSEPMQQQIATAMLLDHPQLVRSFEFFYHSVRDAEGIKFKMQSVLTAGTGCTNGSRDDGGAASLSGEKLTSHLNPRLYTTGELGLTRKRVSLLTGQVLLSRRASSMGKGRQSDDPNEPTAASPTSQGASPSRRPVGFSSEEVEPSVPREGIKLPLIDKKKVPVNGSNGKEKPKDKKQSKPLPPVTGAVAASQSRQAASGAVVKPAPPLPEKTPQQKIDELLVRLNCQVYPNEDGAYRSQDLEEMDLLADNTFVYGILLSELVSGPMPPAKQAESGHANAGGGGLEEGTVAVYAAQVCDVLQYMHSFHTTLGTTFIHQHSHGTAAGPSTRYDPCLIHNNLRAENLLLDSRGNVKVSNVDNAAWLTARAFFANQSKQKSARGGPSTDEGDESAASIMYPIVPVDLTAPEVYVAPELARYVALLKAECEKHHARRQLLLSSYEDAAELLRDAQNVIRTSYASFNFHSRKLEPELVSHVTPALDCYQLGIALYQLLLGRLPRLHGEPSSPVEGKSGAASGASNRKGRKGTTSGSKNPAETCVRLQDLRDGSPRYAQLSEEARSLLEGLILRPAKQRLTVAQVLAHPFLSRRRR